LWTATSTGLLDIAAAQVAATRSGARAEPSQSLRGRRSGPSAERTDIPMMYQLDLAVILAADGTAVLAAVYLWSRDPDRRRRAWRLLKLLRGR
jgi:hypothetical protein